MYTATLLDQQVRCFKLVGRGARKSGEVCGPTMSYEPLGARASKIRRTKTLQKEATATSRCMPHPLYIIPLTHQLYSPKTARLRTQNHDTSSQKMVSCHFLSVKKYRPQMDIRHGHLFCTNDLEPLMIRSMKLAGQAPNSWMTRNESVKGVVPTGPQGTMGMKLGL